jgi:hypothetical protein
MRALASDVQNSRLQVEKTDVGLVQYSEKVLPTQEAAASRAKDRALLATAQRLAVTAIMRKPTAKALQWDQREWAANPA